MILINEFHAYIKFQKEDNMILSKGKDFCREAILFLLTPLRIREAQKMYGNLKEDLFEIYKKCNEIGPMGYNQGEPVRAYLLLYEFTILWKNTHLTKLNEFQQVCGKVRFGRFKKVATATCNLKRWIAAVEDDYMIEAMADASFRIKDGIEHKEIKAAHTLGLAQHMLMGFVGNIDNAIFHG